MKLIIDMNLSPRWVSVFNAEGIDATHWSSLGKANATDMEIFNYAARHNCIILTHDLDFGAILAATHGEKPSVVQIRADNLNPEAIGKKVIIALKQVATELTAGALLTIEPGRARLKLLPLQIK